jgi:hypothetical protein
MMGVVEATGKLGAIPPFGMRKKKMAKTRNLPALLMATNSGIWMPCPSFNSRGSTVPCCGVARPSAFERSDGENGINQKNSSTISPAHSSANELSSVRTSTVTIALVKHSVFIIPISQGSRVLPSPPLNIMIQVVWTLLQKIRSILSD